MYFLYTVLLSLALLLSMPWWLLQMLRLGKYRAGLAERFGCVPQRLVRGAGTLAWVHAVSVGEVLAVSHLVQELRAGGQRVMVSTTTQTGQRLARERFGAENVFYFPVDFPFAIAAYLRRLRPDVVVLAETEFWPMFLRMAARSGACVAVVNARISDRSLPRYRHFCRLLARVLANVDLFLAQSEEDARRLMTIGAIPERVQVSGNLKFDVAPPPAAPFVASLTAALRRSKAGPVIVAGSTLEGEELMVFSAFRQVLVRWPQARLLLAPRHKERFATVAALLETSGFAYRRRSTMTEAVVEGWSVLLLDTIGELASAYSLADVAFVGGSLVPRGGHNILEPANFGVPIVVGRHTENFRDIMVLFRRAGALVECDGAMLGDEFCELLADDDLRRNLGERARNAVATQRGATERTLRALRELLKSRTESLKEKEARP